MATIVCFHAHPDDEAIATGGVMARYSAAGHRVVLVLATRGEHGEVAEGFLDQGEELWQRRVAETQASADLLGVARVAYLDYVDSGMMGTPENDAPGSFWQADVDQAAARLAALLDEEGADVLTHYDENGNYGHPDHIQVHRVGRLAGRLAGTPKVYEATMNRDHIRRLMSVMPQPTEAPDAPDEGFIDTLGVPESMITTGIDVRDFVAAKRASMAAHASQIAESSFFLQMPEEAFRESFGWEWFMLEGRAPGRPWEDDLLEGMSP
jgi:LmbE family N-acetylglucosaminyl deacetylase